MKISKRDLKRRMRLSFLIFFIAISAVVAGIEAIKKQTRVDDTPLALRRGFQLNEKLWKILSSPKKLSVKKASPPKGKAPRFNGDLGLLSPLDLRNYFVEIESGENRMKIPVGAFHAIQRSEYSTDFRCIEGWSEETNYAGARFSDFIKAYHLGKKSDGKYYAYVGLETPDKGYYVSIDMESMLHEQTVLAYEMNGVPLSVENGAPLRLIIPIKYGIKSLKRIGRIFFTDKRPPDYWAERGYDWYSGL